MERARTDLRDSQVLFVLSAGTEIVDSRPYWLVAPRHAKIDTRQCLLPNGGSASQRARRLQRSYYAIALLAMAGTTGSRGPSVSMTPSSSGFDCIIIPCFNPQQGRNMECEWYNELATRAPSHVSVSVLNDFPNPYESNSKRWERVWVAYLKQKLQSSKCPVIAIGHCTGADALLRFNEEEPLFGSVLIAPVEVYHAGERHSRDYAYSLIRQNNQSFIYHIYTDDDVLVPIMESRLFADKLEKARCNDTSHDDTLITRSILLPNRGRFRSDEFPELESLLHDLANAK